MITMNGTNSVSEVSCSGESNNDFVSLYIDLKKTSAFYEVKDSRGVKGFSQQPSIHT